MTTGHQQATGQKQKRECTPSHPGAKFGDLSTQTTIPASPSNQPFAPPRIDFILLKKKNKITPTPPEPNLKKNKIAFPSGMTLNRAHFFSQDFADIMSYHLLTSFGGFCDGVFPSPRTTHDYPLRDNVLERVEVIIVLFCPVGCTSHTTRLYGAPLQLV